MDEKRVVGRRTAMALGVGCIILAAGLVGAIANYVLVTSDKDNTISSMNSEITNLQNQINQLQEWLDSNKTSLSQIEAWFNENNTYYQSQVESYETEIANMTHTISLLNSQIEQLQNQLSARIPGNVTLWLPELLSNELTVWQARISAFEAAFPCITVNLIQKTGLYDELATAVPSGQGPDLYMWFLNSWQAEFVNASIIVPIENCIDNVTLSQYYPNALQAMTYQGHLWALPFSAECITLFYNKAYLTTPPTTTDQLVALMQNESHAGGTAPYQYALAEVTSGAVAPYYLYPWVSGWGGYYYNDTTGLVGLNSTGTVNAANWYNNTILPYMAQSLDDASAEALFMSGNASMLIEGPWFVASVKAANITFGLALIPLISQNDNATPMPFEGVRGLWMTSNVKDQNKQAAITFMKWWTSVDNQIALAKTLGFLPVVAAAYDDEILRNDPVMSGFDNQLKQSISWPSGPQMGYALLGATSAWSAVFQRTQTAQTAFQQAEDSAIANILTKYGHYP